MTSFNDKDFVTRFYPHHYLQFNEEPEHPNGGVYVLIKNPTEKIGIGSGSSVENAYYQARKVIEQSLKLRRMKKFKRGDSFKYRVKHLSENKIAILQIEIQGENKTYYFDKKDNGQTKHLKALFFDTPEELLAEYVKDSMQTVIDFERRVAEAKNTLKKHEAYLIQMIYGKYILEE